jgi:hypothetical protein
MRVAFSVRQTFCRQSDPRDDSENGASRHRFATPDSPDDPAGDDGESEKARQ